MMIEKKRKEKLEKFISQAKIIHNNKYSYSKFVFVNNTTKGIITCPIHGDFLQTPKNHLHGQGCPTCGKEFARNYRKGNYTHFIEESKNRFGDIFEYPFIEREYENSHSKITIKCLKCGNVFTKIACDHLTSPKGGCKVCFKQSFEKYYTYEELLKYNILNLNIKPFEGKKEYRDKCTVICDKHGEYEVIINTILKGNGKCKKCAGKTVTEVNEFKNQFIERYGDKLDCNYDEYVNMSTEITFTCKECGCVFKRKPTSILHSSYKSICPNCSRQIQNIEKTKTTEQFIEDLNKIYGEDAFDTTGLQYIKSSDYVTLKCNKCGRIFRKEANSLLQGNGCPFHHLNVSIAEEEIRNYITSLGEEVIYNDRTILNNRYEIDIYVPSKKIAIEYDGLYWHNELNKTKDYHLSKTIECETNNIRLIHIFEDEWIDENKNKIWKSMLNSLLHKDTFRIFARKCKVLQVDMKTSKNFLEKNHLQGYCNSQFNYGLFYNNELVSLMTFGKTRHFIGNSSHQYELLRFCNKLNTIVVGAASKLLKHFIKDLEPNNIVSYADRRWSNGNLYEKLGFKLYNKSKPNYYYVIKNERKNRFNFRKSMLMKKYNCPSNMSEHEFCLANKWYRIYDCGCLCYEWNKN